MYQIINLGALANNRAVHGSTVNAGVVANLYIILQHYITGLQHLAVLAVLSNIAEAITADNRTGLQNNPVAQHAILTDGGIRIKSAILAHFYAFANISVRINNAAVTNLSIVLYYRKGLDSNIATDFCFFGYISIRTDNALYLLLRAEQLQQGSKSCTRVSNSDNRTAIKLRILGAQNHYTGLAEMTMLYMRRHSKGNILRTCLHQSIDTGNEQFGVIMLYCTF